ncbi:hypothetical protein GE09DRAFT_1275419 [Coniochaeta sp. 2T2.1]|nr:hypothetical protein GE09DRAFT_1275419 [Coniochaeta sp. 2T2.1]
MAETRQIGVVGKRSADGELAEAPLVKKYKLEADVMYGSDFDEYTTDIPSSRVPIAGHSNADELTSLLEAEFTSLSEAELISLLDDELIADIPATPGAADTADDEIEPEATEVDAEDIAPRGPVPLTDDQRQLAEKAALKMGLRPDSVGQNMSFGEFLDHSDVTKGTREDIERFAWESKVGDKWPDVQELFTTFNYSLLRRSPIVMLVGTPVAQAFRRRVSGDSSLSVEKVTLKLGGIRSLGDKPHFLVVRSRATNAVEQLVFAATHGSRFYHLSVQTHEGVTSDLMWNTAATIAGVRVSSPSHFTRAALSHGGGFPGRTSDEMKAFWASDRGRAIIADWKERKIGIFKEESRAKIKAWQASEEGKAFYADQQARGFGIHSKESREAVSQWLKAFHASEEGKAFYAGIHADQQARGIAVFSEESKVKAKVKAKEWHTSEVGRAFHEDQQARGVGMFSEESKAKRAATQAAKKGKLSPEAQKAKAIEGDVATKKACLAEARFKERAAKAEYVAAKGRSSEDEAAMRHITASLAVNKANADLKKAEKEAKKAKKTAK